MRLISEKKRERKNNNKSNSPCCKNNNNKIIIRFSSLKENNNHQPIYQYSIMSTATTVLPQKFRYLSAWFCPFAHRATLALEHHSTRVEYEWVEALGWEKRSNKDNVTGTDHEWWYHYKSPELIRACPGGLVPTLIPIIDGRPDESKAVYESIVTIEYIDAVSGATGKDRLISEDPFLAARARVWADKVNRECCSTYYGVLVRKDGTERKDNFNNLIKGLEVSYRNWKK
jgi:glutathione S-transferase